MAVDKQSLIIIAFIAVFVISAAFLAMGLIPEIFRQGEQIDQALLQQHEDEARANQTLHEDLEREKQFERENEARDQQRYLIINETNNSLNKMEEHLMDFIIDSENRSARGAAERQAILETVDTSINNQQAQLSKQNSELKLLKGQQEYLQNMTTDISNLTAQVLNLTKVDTEGATEHRNSSLKHHEALLKLMEKIDENLVANITN